MNGQLLLLLLAMLLQTPSSEVLPEPIRNGNGFVGNSAVQPGNPVSAPNAVLPPIRGRRLIGYASDPLDGNKFCLIVQIPPDEIGEFARGPAGQELTALVPDEIRNFRIDKIIFRIGTDPVEKILPNMNALSDNRPFSNSNAPQIVDLNSRSTVSIDQPRPQSNLATVAQNGAGFAGSATMPNNGNPGYYNNNDGGTFPPVVPNTLNDRSRPISTLGNGSGGLDNGFNSNQNNRTDVLPSQNPTLARDGFSPKPSAINNFLVPSQNNQTNPAYASSTFPYAPGNTTSPNTLGANSNGNRQFNLASNATNPPSYYDSQFSQQNNQQLPQGGYVPSPSAAQANQFGQPVTSQPSYVGSNPYPTGQTPTYLQTPPPVQKPPFAPQIDLEEPLPKDKLLPFLLLFSIVVNVYLGFWMSHLRTRYRQLLSNMRGIPVSDLA